MPAAPDSADLREPAPGVLATIERVVGSRARGFAAVVGGYTPAQRWTFDCAAGRLFAKVGVTPLTAAMLRRECVAYAALQGDFMPRVIGRDDRAEPPVLVLEDLSGAAWLSPWTPARVRAVADALAELHACRAALPGHAEVHGARVAHWAAVAADPAAFLALGCVPASWLEASLPALMDAEARCAVDGSAPTHGDVRSDNLCFRDGRAVLLDWAESCLSNPGLDLGFWLPSLAHEGGPLPEALLPARPDIAAWVSGFFAARAGLPVIPDAPRVRLVQRQQLQTALPWAARALGLPGLPARCGENGA